MNGKKLSRHEMLKAMTKIKTEQTLNRNQLQTVKNTINIFTKTEEKHEQKLTDAINACNDLIESATNDDEQLALCAIVCNHLITSFETIETQEKVRTMITELGRGVSYVQLLK